MSSRRISTSSTSIFRMYFAKWFSKECPSMPQQCVPRAPFGHLPTIQKMIIFGEGTNCWFAHFMDKPAVNRKMCFVKVVRMDRLIQKCTARELCTGIGGLHQPWCQLSCGDGIEFEFHAHMICSCARTRSWSTIGVTTLHSRRCTCKKRQPWTKNSKSSRTRQSSEDAMDNSLFMHISFDYIF